MASAVWLHRGQCRDQAGRREPPTIRPPSTWKPGRGLGETKKRHALLRTHMYMYVCVSYIALSM